MKKILICSLMSLLSMSAFANSYNCTGFADVTRKVSNDGNGEYKSEQVLFMLDMIVPLDGVSRVFLVENHDSYNNSVAKNGAITIEAGYGENFYIAAGFYEDRSSIRKLPWGTHVGGKDDSRLHFATKKLPDDFSMYYRKGESDKEGETFYQIDCVLITQE